MACVINEDSYYIHDKLWDSQMKSLNNEHQFITLLVPLMTRLYSCLAKKLSGNSFVTGLIDDAILKDIIFYDVKQTWLPRIMRALVLELHTARELGELKGDTPEKRFAYFIHLLSVSELQDNFFERYPVLKVQIDKYFEYFIKNTVEIIFQLQSDLEEIKRSILKVSANTPIKLTKIEKKGDSHRFGRNVALLHLSANGHNRILVYKPRSVNMDLAFYQVLSWLNVTSQTDFFIPEILKGEDYGWYEYISHTSCQTEAQVRKYYSQLGGLLAIMHVLFGADIHTENVIAHGEYPVVIDLECLLLPLLNFEQNLTIKPYHLVTETLILPLQSMINKDYKGIDLSAFGSLPGQGFVQPALKTINGGTDYMTVERVEYFSVLNANLPLLNGNAIEQLLYTNEFKSGFTQIYNTFIQHKKYFAMTILPAFKDVECRLVFRQTYEYAKLILESYHPLLLENEQKYIEHFDWLADDDETEFKKSLFTNEIQDILNLDVPIFLHRVNSLSILDSRSIAMDIIVMQSGYQRLIEQLEHHTNQRDLSIQLTVIEQCFCTYKMNRKMSSPARQRQSNNSYLQNNASVLHQRCKIIVNKLLLQLSDLALDEGDSISWPSISQVGPGVWIPTVEHGIELYQGTTGIGLLFAHAATYFKNKKYKALAFKIGNSFIKQVANRSATMEHSLGFFSGIGGYLYYAAKMYQLFPELQTLKLIPSLLQTYELSLRKPTDVDIIGGLAGGLMGLLMVKSVCDPEIWQRLAAASVEKILAVYPRPSEKHLIDVEIKSTQSLLGYSHGISGITLSLWLYQQQNSTKDSRINTWISEALEYERRCYSSTANNWSDFRENSVRNNSTYNTFAWCHGAPGITLARMQLYENNYHDSSIADEIFNGLRAIKDHGFHQHFQLCHGDFGNLDILLYAVEAGFLSLGNYSSILTVLVNQLGDGTNLLLENGMDAFNAGIMTGNSGIAYQLLRCLSPQTIPSLLALGAAI